MQGFPQPEISSLEKLRKLTQILPSWRTRSLESYSKSEVAKPAPIPEFCLGKEHLDFVRPMIPAIKRVVSRDVYSHGIGMETGALFPVTFSDGITTMMVKFPRLDPEKLFRQIKIEEQAALQLGVINFAPTHYLDGALVQRQLIEDESMSWQERANRINYFIYLIKDKVGSSDAFSPTNYVITRYGVGIVDINSCDFSSKLKLLTSLHS